MMIAIGSLIISKEMILNDAGNVLTFLFLYIIPSTYIQIDVLAKNTSTQEALDQVKAIIIEKTV